MKIGSAGTGPAPGSLHSLTKIRIEQIARYRVAGVRDGKIAELLSIPIASFRQIVQMPEYKDVEEALLVGQLTQMDLALAGRVEPLRQEVRNAVPAALRCLVDACNQRRDLRTALAASVEILKRDPDQVAPDLGRTRGEDGIRTIDSIPESLMSETAKQADDTAQKLATKRVQ